MVTLSEPLLRRADERDLPQIMAIERASFTSPWSESYFRHELYNPITHFYLIEYQERVAGYIVFWLIADEIHIANLAVHPQFRKAGLGTKLLNYALEMGQKNKVKQVTLEVNEHNTAAIQLYTKLQFKSLGRRPKYYENRDDALIMSRQL